MFMPLMLEPILESLRARRSSWRVPNGRLGQTRMILRDDQTWVAMQSWKHAMERLGRPKYNHVWDDLFLNMTLAPKLILNSATCTCEDLKAWNAAETWQEGFVDVVCHVMLFNFPFSLVESLESEGTGDFRPSFKVERLMRRVVRVKLAPAANNRCYFEAAIS